MGHGASVVLGRVGGGALPIEPRALGVGRQQEEDEQDDPAENGIKPMNRHPPDRFVSCRRRHASASHGMNVARPKR